MVKEYTLKGLDCANCANKIETAVKTTKGIHSASLNFMTSTLHIEIIEDQPENLNEKIGNIVHKYEPDVIVTEKNLEKKMHEHAENGEKAQLITLISGAAIFAAGIFFENLFQLHQYLSLTIYLFAYIILGGETLLRAVKNIARGQIFDENFLMSLATIGALITKQYHEAVAVMLFYQIGEYFQDMAVRKSKKSIADLMDIRPDYANIKKDGAIIKVTPDTVNVHDIIIVKPGEKIPLDGIVIDGEASLDTAALTGESAPREVSVGDTVLSGCINQNGVLTVEVTKTFGESTAAKILDLVENASAKKSRTENFITTFSRYYTPAVVALAALISVIPPLFMDGGWIEWINRGLIFLVISCPCALVVSIPLGFFGGIGGASKKGILVKGSSYLEAMGNLDTIVFDKTGTLTKGVFKVTGIYPAEGISKDKLLETAAYAEAFSNHPIAVSIQKEYGKKINKAIIFDYKEIPGQGISVKINNSRILAGGEKLLNLNSISFRKADNIGTKVYVAIDGIFAGRIIIADEIKTDSYAAISALKAKGVRKTIMLTGDNLQTGEAVAKELKLDEAYCGLLPDQKVEKVEMLNLKKSSKGKLAFVGDGINDAPVLALADVGIAMGGVGSDAAIEAADIVIMTDEPSKIAEAIDIAKKTKKIVIQNVIFALGIKGIIMLLGAFGIATMWAAVFADVGVALLAVLNSLRAMRVN